MVRWLKSIQMKTLGIMALATILGLGLTFFVINGIESKIEVSQELQTLSKSSLQLLNLSRSGATEAQLLAASSALTDEKVVIKRGDTIIFQTGPVGQVDSKELSRVARSRLTTVQVFAPIPSSSWISLELTAASVVLMLLALIAALIISRMITRSLSSSIAKAIDTAQKVARGDLTARIGSVESEEFQSLAHAFDSMAAKLEDHENEQKKFLGDLSHEIATPINAVSGFALAICDKTITNQEEMSEAAWLIQEETDRINHLLADLRTLDRLDIAHTVTKEEFYVDIYVKELVLRFSANSSPKFLTISWDAPHEEIFIDRRLLDMVVSNFLSNSIRYANPHGKVWITVKETASDLIFSVADNGIGIAPHHLNRIFDRLYRVDEARDRVSGGSGLGLAIARRAAQSLGASIEVESESGKGSEFRLVIPLTNMIYKHTSGQSNSDKESGAEVSHRDPVPASKQGG